MSERTILHGGGFLAADLRLVAPAPPPDDPPLAVGDRCALNSGGPAFVVVDASEGAVLVAWWRAGGEVAEHEFPRACVRRVQA